MLENLISWAGLPVFVYLLLRSRLHYKWRRQLVWKDRIYRPGAHEEQAVSAKPE